LPPDPQKIERQGDGDAAKLVVDAKGTYTAQPITAGLVGWLTLLVCSSATHLLSALGVPNKTQVQCFVGDLGMRRGILEFKAMTLDTGEGITNVSSNVDLSKENHRPGVENGREWSSR
jgi:hypothetical protein